jgi:hypothetical protein
MTARTPPIARVVRISALLRLALIRRELKRFDEQVDVPDADHAAATAPLPGRRSEAVMNS